jgi:DNA-directed RNA polymerase specialized sigma24 family protein
MAAIAVEEGVTAVEFGTISMAFAMGSIAVGTFSAAFALNLSALVAFAIAFGLPAIVSAATSRPLHVCFLSSRKSAVEQEWMSPAARVPTALDGRFVSTRWTIVLRAGDSQLPSADAGRALSDLCRIYWRPLYLFLRREGIGSEDAQDLTQGFFATLIRDRSYRRADREKGRFRSFLLGALKHFVADARDLAHAQKRGGGAVHELFDQKAIDEVEAQVQTAEQWSASVLFDREWAAALLRQTLDRLAQECAIAGKAALFDNLRTYLAGTNDEAIPYEEMSQRLHRNSATLRSDVARLRTRYRAILREEVGGTVLEPAEVDDELRYLCQVLAQA